MIKPAILIVGGGFMGGALAQQWLHEGWPVTVVEPSGARRGELTAIGLTCHATLVDAPRTAVVVLAIKPQQFAESQTALAEAMGGQTPPLLISMLAGTPLAALQKVSPRAMRVMPNLPAQIGEGMSVLCAPGLDRKDCVTSEQLFGAVGVTAWVESEAQLHAITAISGSGPAYLFAFMEGLEQAALAHGLRSELAKLLVIKTMRGAALMADGASQDVASLRAQVTSKGGTTQAALEALLGGNFAAVISAAVDAAVARSEALSEL